MLEVGDNPSDAEADGASTTEAIHQSGNNMNDN